MFPWNTIKHTLTINCFIGMTMGYPEICNFPFRSENFLGWHDEHKLFNTINKVLNKLADNGLLPDAPGVWLPQPLTGIVSSFSVALPRSNDDLLCLSSAFVTIAVVLGRQSHPVIIPIHMGMITCSLMMQKKQSLSWYYTFDRHCGCLEGSLLC